MITGATQVIGPVPGRNLDPFLVARSQSVETHAFCVIGYDGDIRSFDFLFLRGTEILHAARMTEEYRLMIPPEMVRDTFQAERDERQSLVHLFSAPADLVNRFIATFHFMPRLRIELGILGPRHLVALLGKTVTGRSLVEFNRPGAELPLIELIEISSPECLSVVKSIPRQGHLLLYDLESNSQMLRDKARVRVYMLSKRDTVAPVHTPAQTPSTPEPPVAEVPAQSAPPPVVRVPEESKERELSKEEIEIISLMDGMIRSFRKMVCDVSGKSGPAIFERAVKEMRERVPGVRFDFVDMQSAPHLFDMLEVVARIVPLWRRSRVRSIAATLVSEIYVRHHTALERSGLLSKAEEVYRKLQQ